jgi:hypothetical protein
MICVHCKCSIDSKELKVWRWAGWAVYGPATSSPAPPSKPREIDRKVWETSIRDEWDWSFHKQCFPEWIHNRNEGLQDLDRPVNSCVYFQRTGTSIHGYYVREGKKHPCLAAWTEYDVLDTALFPTQVEPFPIDLPSVVVTVDNGFLLAFQSFLKKNGWLDSSWYLPRKEMVLKDDVAMSMRLRQATA